MEPEATRHGGETAEYNGARLIEVPAYIDKSFLLLRISIEILVTLKVILNN